MNLCKWMAEQGQVGLVKSKTLLRAKRSGGHG